MLEGLVGRTVACPEERCPLWESRAAGGRAGCILDGVPLAFEPTAVAHELLALRDRLLLLGSNGNDLSSGGST
jgi:hypothetical protein